MCQEILPELFQLKIPLPESPLKYLNSYVIRDAERSLIIDTGLNRRECLEAMQAGLRQLGIDLKKADFFITHLHADHFGLVGKLATDASDVYFSRPEKELMESWGRWANGAAPSAAFQSTSMPTTATGLSSQVTRSRCGAARRSISSPT